jgi:hypothetical protein
MENTTMNTNPRGSAEFPDDGDSPGDHLGAAGYARPPSPQQLATDIKLREALLNPPNEVESERRWEKFRHYALDDVQPILLGWIKDGSIYERAARFGRFAGPTPPPGWTARDREEVVVAAIHDAIASFKHMALERWDPRGGASLKTWFVKACVIAFTGAFNHWYTETRLASSISRRRESPEQKKTRVDVTSYDADDDPLRDRLACPTPGPEELACLRDEVRRVMAAAPQKDRLAYSWTVELESYGFAPHEARRITGLPEHILRKRKEQHRRNLQSPDDAAAG